MKATGLRFLVALAAVATVVAAIPGSGAAAPAADEYVAEHDDSTVLVGFVAGTTAAQATALAASVNANDVQTVGAGTHKLKVASGKVASTINALKSNPAVRYAEPDYIVHATLAPSDPLYGELWGMNNTGQAVRGISGTPGADIDAEPAWDVTTGSSTIVVGVVDTGIDYNHPNLAANVWSNPGGVGGCGAGTHGYNAITSSCNPMDDNNHGTHVSGTIGAVGNQGLGVAGVNWTSSLMGLKFLNAGGSGTTAGAIAAIEFSVQAKIAGVNVRVLNNSWGGGGFSQGLSDEINKAGANDIMFVAAAGNGMGGVGFDVDVLAFYPCSYKAANEICVAATDQDDNKAGFSNYGATTVDMGAPGTNILSTTIGGGYSYFAGTSMATPHVVGAAALVLSSQNMTTAALKQALRDAVDPVASMAGRTITGGRLNVCNAITGCVSGH